jgi:hypothetical protein
MTVRRACSKRNCLLRHVLPFHPHKQPLPVPWHMVRAREYNHFYAMLLDVALTGVKA